jgi:hypothetical protein
MSDWEFNTTTLMWHNPITGVSLTQEQVRRLDPAEVTRITGVNPLVTDIADDATAHRNRPLLDDINPQKISTTTVIRFKTHGKFTYAGIYVPVGDHDKCWYITGAGKWFGTNALTNDQMSEVLKRETTSHIRVMMPLSDDAASILT